MLSTHVGIDWTLADELSSKKRYAEAATVLLDYAGDVRQAVIAYVEGNLFADARRIVSSSAPLAGNLLMFPCQVSLHAMQELMEEVIHPGALETKSQLAEELGEMKSQLLKQVARVRELRVKKVEQPGTEFTVYFFGQGTNARIFLFLRCVLW